MTNKEIREAAKANRVYSYEVADALGVSEATMTRKMRRELPQDEKRRILEAIDRLAQQKQEVV